MNTFETKLKPGDKIYIFDKLTLECIDCSIWYVEIEKFGTISYLDKHKRLICIDKQLDITPDYYCTYYFTNKNIRNDFVASCMK